MALAGPLAWYGLLYAAVHPSLALCFVVPFLPLSLAPKKPKKKDDDDSDLSDEEEDRPRLPAPRAPASVVLLVVCIEMHDARQKTR